MEDLKISAFGSRDKGREGKKKKEVLILISFVIDHLEKAVAYSKGLVVD